jgi:hypothetical protein
MSAFHHLGYFPFCIQSPLEPLSRAVEMPLADAMKLFWLVKQARFVMRFSYNAHLRDGGDFFTFPNLFVRASVNIDQTQEVLGNKSLEERVCENGSLTISGSAQNEDGEGSTQYVLRFFADSAIVNNDTFPQVTAADISLIPPQATVRVTSFFYSTSSGYYSNMLWFNTLSPPIGRDGAVVIPLQINLDGNNYTLSTGVGYVGYPYVNQGGPTPSASYEDFRVELTT